MGGEGPGVTRSDVGSCLTSTVADTGACRTSLSGYDVYCTEALAVAEVLDDDVVVVVV